MEFQLLTKVIAERKISKEGAIYKNTIQNRKIDTLNTIENGRKVKYFTRIEATIGFCFLAGNLSIQNTLFTSVFLLRN